MTNTTYRNVFSFRVSIRRTFLFEFYDKFDKWDWDKVPGVMRVSPRPETPGARDQIFSESPEPEPWMGPEPRPDPSYRDWGGGGSHSLLVWRWPGADTGTCAASWASPSRSPSSSRVRTEYEDVVHIAPAQPVTFFELETCSLVRRFCQSQNIWKPKKNPRYFDEERNYYNDNRGNGETMSKRDLMFDKLARHLHQRLATIYLAAPLVWENKTRFRTSEFRFH